MFWVNHLWLHLTLHSHLWVSTNEEIKRHYGDSSVHGFYFKILRTDALGVSTDGNPRDLEDAVYMGASVRLNIEQDELAGQFFTEADNVRVSFLTNEVTYITRTVVSLFTIKYHTRGSHFQFDTTTQTCYTSWHYQLVQSIEMVGNLISKLRHVGDTIVL